MYNQGWNVVTVEKLLDILHQLPREVHWIGVSMTGALGVLDAQGGYLGYIDLAYEERFFPKEEVEANAAKQIQKVDETTGPSAAHPR